MSAPLYRITQEQSSPEEELFDAILSESTSFDIKSIQLLANGEGNLSLRVMLMLEGDHEWFLIRTPPLSHPKAIFIAEALLQHHRHHYPERASTLDRWLTTLNDSNVPFHGISLIMGVN